MATKSSSESLRSQLKATPIKKLKKQVDEDNEMIGAYASNEYLNLEDGKTIKIRIFPAHPGVENFYVPKKCYWLSVAGNDGDMRRTQVLDSRAHGGTKMDLIDEYVKWAKKKWAKDSDRLEALTGSGPNSNSLNPQYSWLCYADKVTPDGQLRAKLWEFKKMVRDYLNKLAFSEDEDEAIEIDPFTDPDEGLPVLVKYMKNPNKKKGENYYEVSFPKKVAARPLSDEEIEYFMSLKPLSEILPKYGMRDFERALEGLQNFDEENEIGLFEDDDWLEHVEEVKAQYDGDSEDDEEEDEKPKAKKTSKKVTKKAEPEEEDEESDDDEEEEEEEEKPAPKKSTSKKTSKKPEPEDDEEDDDDTEEESNDDEEEDELDDLDRNGLKKYIRENELEVSIKKSMSDDDIREAIREALAEQDDSGDDSDDEEEDDEEEDEKPKAKVSLSDIKKKLAGKK